MMKDGIARIVFAGGGTGGHYYPAVAIANRIRDLMDNRAVEISFVGTRRGIEFRMRKSLGYPLHLVNIRGIQRSLSLSNLLVPFLIVGSLFKAYSIIRKCRPDVVVGTGGYVSWPVLRMASFLKIPTVLQEQNSYPGITTRKLALGADRVYLGFEDGRKYLRTKAEIIVSGNPVRAEINLGNRDEAIKAFGLDPNKVTILIIGGSQGARAINQAIMRSMEKSPIPDGIQIIWQTGKREYKDVAAFAGDKVSSLALFPFAENMPDVYAAADMAVARAGALTLAELEACGIPSLLIPFPFAAGDHQRKNAKAFVEAGASVVIDENDLAGRDILKEAAGIINSGRLALMQDAVRKMNRREKPAVDIIARDIIDMVKIKQEVEG